MTARRFISSHFISPLPPTHTRTHTRSAKSVCGGLPTDVIQESAKDMNARMLKFCTKVQFRCMAYFQTLSFFVYRCWPNISHLVVMLPRCAAAIPFHLDLCGGWMRGQRGIREFVEEYGRRTATRLSSVTHHNLFFEKLGRNRGRGWISTSVSGRRTRTKPAA